MTIKVPDWARWRPREQATLLFVVRQGQILLIRKKRGLGAGKINGPGGRVDGGETAREAAIRETREELRITPVGVRKAGEVWFQVIDGPSIKIHVYRADDCAGEPTETEEAVPMWTPVASIPYSQMWEDDRLWLPLLLAGEPFRIATLFDGDALVHHERVDSGRH